MNEGKICVSVCTATADELIEQIRRAEESADVIEIRFDCIERTQLRKALAFLASKKPLLLTYRPAEQGGKITADVQERVLFWKVFSADGLTDARKLWFDYEYDLPEMPKTSNQVTIRSYHDFAKSPENLAEIYENLAQRKAIPKIAVQTADLTDSIPVWKLLKKAKSENREIIPIAMGESGKWTRILGLAHGARLTYAALDAGQETAPGQVSAGDLRKVYRAKELNEETEVYGILGGNTSVSLSPYLHNEAFKFHRLNAVFVPLQVQNLDEFVRRMVNPATREIKLNFGGFAVTMPHKQNIIKHLDFLDDSARAIGAVNTVKIADGKLSGYNTDADGFLEPLLNSYGNLRNAKVAVLGAGGAARACVYALKRQSARVTIFARNLDQAKSLAAEFGTDAQLLGAERLPLTTYKDFDILVNTTPLGMKGKAETETPATGEQLKGLHLVYDLVYTPFQTRLLREADLAEVPKIGGLAMLVAQAARQQKIWTGFDAPIKEMSRAALDRLQSR